MSPEVMLASARATRDFVNAIYPPLFMAVLLSQPLNCIVEET